MGLHTAVNRESVGRAMIELLKESSPLTAKNIREKIGKGTPRRVLQVRKQVYLEMALILERSFK